jgi:type IV fimbrial biogenesis protein FimT
MGEGFPDRRSGSGPMERGADRLEASRAATRDVAQMPRIAQGFTLLEALIAMAVIAILACVAVPAWSNAREAAHNGSAQAALLHSLMGAISHAALTGSEVVLCPGDAGGCRASTDWSHGWIAFADIDGDRVRDPSDTLLKAIRPLGGKVHLRTTSGRTRLVFQPNGGNAGSNVTFTVCDGRGPAKAATLVMANDGRLRAGQPTWAAAADCMVER